MTKREFVEQWVLKYASPDTSADQLRSLIHNANFVWDTMEPEIPPDPVPQPRDNSITRWLFGG